VRTEAVDAGQHVVTGAHLARIYAVDYAEIPLGVHDSELQHLDMSLSHQPGRESDDAKAPAVVLSTEFAGARHEWHGHIVRTEGEIDPRTRMVNLVARIERPYESATQNGGQPGRPPLAVGMFVEARITGRTYNQVFAVPRQALRGNDTVLVVDANDRVQARAVKLLRSEGERVLVREGLASGERLCLSLLEGFTEGMAVRTVESEATPAGQR
jgi:multidrug efflux pump subunit AcrA (membrane-fusion protein)